MSRKANRLIWIGVIGIVLSGAVGLSMFALREGISFALSPSELKAASIGPTERVRLFGLVEEGSVNRAQGLDVSFVLTDTDETIRVRYQNILPDLFREGQGIITEGVLGTDGTFHADTVLAKHDENYMPEGMAEKLKEKGVWKEASQ